MILNDGVTLKNAFYLMKNGNHNFGWDTWKGKPFFACEFFWYDSPRFCFILYKFYWHVDYD